MKKEKLKEIWDEMFEEFFESKEGIVELTQIVKAYKISKELEKE